jgi:shikimate dehydrogenase
MPLKRVALEVADEVAPLAAEVGAANTLLLADGVRRVENTDVAGIARALRVAGVRDVGAAVVLGAGGTAQAALAALRDLGNTTPSVLVRDVSRAGDLRAAAERLGVRPAVSATLFSAPLPEADVVVSTLPSRAADPLAERRWRGRPVVLDVVYTGWPTRLATSAAAAGCSVVSGLEVLLHQAAEQVRLMTGGDPPVEAMRTALSAAVTSLADSGRPSPS